MNLQKHYISKHFLVQRYDKSRRCFDSIAAHSGDVDAGGGDSNHSARHERQPQKAQ